MRGAWAAEAGRPHSGPTPPPNPVLFTPSHTALHTGELELDRVPEAGTLLFLDRWGDLSSHRASTAGALVNTTLVSLAGLMAGAAVGSR